MSLNVSTCGGGSWELLYPVSAKHQSVTSKEKGLGEVESLEPLCFQTRPRRSLLQSFVMLVCLVTVCSVTYVATGEIGLDFHLHVLHWRG